MTDTFSGALPHPELLRWQPMRLGLVELFHYDSEEFWFRDGHLLLRGNNGTGKSKVLSLTLPLLFDAQLKSSRVEPDGDPGKKMAWNLLLGRHERRMGYTWIEFGRLDASGQAHFLTLGCGLAAAAARAQVDSWFFLLDQARIGQDLWLMNANRVVLTRERLREAVQGHGGQVFDTAAAYRRAVDERLFHLGPTRYGALMDTLIQLRQPQLSKRPDESNLSNALTEALPPMSPDLLADVAEALNQLEEYRRELAEYETLERAVGQFNQRYRRYAATQARRQAASLRSAQTGFDNASRELGEGRAALRAAQEAEEAARARHADSEAALAASRVRLEELQNDPAMTSAKQLELAEREAQRRQREAVQAQGARREARSRLEREQQASHFRAQRVEHIGRVWAEAREASAHDAQQAGIEADHANSPLAGSDAGVLAALSPLALDTARQDLRRIMGTRREQVEQLLRRCDETERAAREHAGMQSRRDERRDEAELAAERRERADGAVEWHSDALSQAWQAHLGSLRQLRIVDDAGLLQELAVWAGGLAGDNPARAALHAAQQAAAQRLAQRHAALKVEQESVEGQRGALLSEQNRLEQGEDAIPPVQYWRHPDARAARPGAPLWQVVDFLPGIPDAERAGIEAALQAAGLLDAWIEPDGTLLAADGLRQVHDARWQLRPAQEHSLSAYLQAATHEASPPVAPAVVQGLLEGVACSGQDQAQAEAWIGTDGQFRLGALAGAWHKPRAEFIGYAARAAARARRLEEISQELQALAQIRERLQRDVAQLDADQEQAAVEWRTAPSDDALRAAHVDATAAAREFQTARQRLEQAEQQLREAADRWEAARRDQLRDAEDLSLPSERSALQAIIQALQVFGDSLSALTSAVRELRDAMAEQVQQQQREQEAAADAARAEEQAAEREALAEEARIRFETLHESVGTAVEELRQRLSDVRKAVTDSEVSLRQHGEVLRETGEARARAEQKTEDAENKLEERNATRQAAISQLQGFAATGLLLTAWPDADLPSLQTPWTIEPALTLARRTEQALADVKSDDDSWSRVQSQVSQDYTELGRALAALSHQAQAETSDYGLVVSIVYQNRPERPDQLALRLAGEIAQRRELLTAGEREVLENHLQAEIASAVQRLLRDAERQISAINAELEKRPTSTGVRFRLQWQVLPEGAQGAPVGLEAARRRLLNTSTDLWTAEDRGVVGEMLQQRIAAERSHADADHGGSLQEQLARALDYRRWHRFRVQRWQDGQWRPLAGPASSGERALGLTVPLFAAVSSYYSQADAAHAPRLVLLDEAFAGIDDAARAHCMALIREFDLDFVITSEREWGCYAELPGVAIAQLQRREGIDAVHVSRWTWDGRARRREADPDRRFPPAA